jgi:hypothetical protein
MQLSSSCTLLDYFCSNSFICHFRVEIHKLEAKILGFNDNSKVYGDSTLVNGICTVLVALLWNDRLF